MGVTLTRTQMHSDRTDLVNLAKIYIFTNLIRWCPRDGLSHEITHKLKANSKELRELKLSPDWCQRQVRARSRSPNYIQMAITVSQTWLTASQTCLTVRLTTSRSRNLKGSAVFYDQDLRFQLLYPYKATLVALQHSDLEKHSGRIRYWTLHLINSNIIISIPTTPFIDDRWFIIVSKREPMVTYTTKIPVLNSYEIDRVFSTSMFIQKWHHLQWRES